MKQKVISLIIIFMVCFSSCTSDRIVQEEITSLPSKSQNPSSRKPAPSTPSPEKETPFSPAPATGTEDIYHGSDLLKGYKICIDPGHQASGNKEKELCAPWNKEMKAKCTSGTCGNFTGTDEYIINLSIAQKLQQKLISLGAEVLMTRETHDVNLSNRERAELASRFGADITLRIHCNSAESESVEGIELYVRGNGDGTAEYRKKAEADYKKASEMIGYLCTETGAISRGIFQSDAYTGINWCENTCIIVECGFLSNEKEDRLLNTAAYQEQIVEGIVNYFISSRVSSDKKISGL